MTPFQVYFITRLDDIKELLGGVITTCLVLGTVGSIVLTGVYMTLVEPPRSSEDSIKLTKRMLKICSMILLPAALVLSVAGALLPSTKQMAAIVVIPSIVNNDHIQALPNKLLRLADDWIEELSPKTPKEETDE